MRNCDLQYRFRQAERLLLPRTAPRQCGQWRRRGQSGEREQVLSTGRRRPGETGEMPSARQEQNCIRSPRRSPGNSHGCWILRLEFTVIFTVNLSGTSIGAGFRPVRPKLTFRDQSTSIGSGDHGRDYQHSPLQVRHAPHYRTASSCSSHCQKSSFCRNFYRQEVHGEPVPADFTT